jgi:hypothetical protein
MNFANQFAGRTSEPIAAINLTSFSPIPRTVRTADNRDDGEHSFGCSSGSMKVEEKHVTSETGDEAREVHQFGIRWKRQS